MGGKKKTQAAASATSGSTTIPGTTSTSVTTTPAPAQPAVLAGQSGLAIHPSHGFRTISTAARTVANAKAGTTLGGYGSSHGGYGGSSTYTTSTGMKEGGWSYNAQGYRTTANKGSKSPGYSPAASRSISSGKGGLY